MLSETEQYRRINVVQISQREGSSAKRPSSTTNRPSFKILKTINHRINHNQVDTISPAEINIEEMSSTDPSNNINVARRDSTITPVETNENKIVPVTTKNNQIRPAFADVDKSSPTVTSSSNEEIQQQKLLSTSKRKRLLKTLLFVSTLTVLILSLIIVPIVVVHSLPMGVSSSTEKNSCSSTRLLTFDDITSLNSGFIPQGYGSFNWAFATYTNASAIGSVSMSLFSGSFAASIDITNPLNRLKITRTNGNVFHLCSLALASVSGQIPFTIIGFRSTSIVYTVNITIDSVSPLLLDLASKKSAVDLVEMFGYGSAFVFDNLVIGG